WSVSSEIRWSLSRGIGGQFAPKSGGQYQRILQIIATICILALIGYFRLQNAEVFIYAVFVLAISFMGFVLSFIIKSSTNRYIKFLLNILVTCIIIVTCAVIIGFGIFIFTDSNLLLKKIFKVDQTDTSQIRPFSTKLHSLLCKVEFNSSLCDVLTYELGEDSCEHVKYRNLLQAGECGKNDIRYYWRPIEKSRIKEELYPYLKSVKLFSSIWNDGYVTYFFQDNKLTRISIRFVPKTDEFDHLFIKSLIDNTPIKEAAFISEEVDNIHYVVGSSFQDGHIIELFASNDQGYSSCIHDWWHSLKNQ
ncbi:hypothetical protein C8P68_1011, partial [Mucilaginibacter yixingensis]